VDAERFGLVFGEAIDFVEDGAGEFDREKMICHEP